MTDNEREPLIPLGFFAVLSYTRAEERARRVLRSLQGGLREDPRPIIPYLRSGRILLALMEQTDDLLDDEFSVPGGSGIMTDGVYFWRVDTADYVEHHRVALPSDFLEHGRRRDWHPPDISPEREAEADREVEDFYRASFDASLWPDDPGKERRDVTPGSAQRQEASRDHRGAGHG
jgi:hypothetical protein